MNHSIKINRSRKISRFVPTASKEIESSIPESLVESLSARQLAEVRLALNDHWHKAVSHTEKEIVGEGCVWSEKHKKLLEIEFPKEGYGKI